MMDLCSQTMKDLTVSPEEASAMEVLTRGQHMCPAWMQLRYGRITASVFGDACRTRIDRPSATLLDKILQKKVTPDVDAIKWGRQMEGKAREDYAAVMRLYHQNWTCSPSGLVLSSDYPHLGASPDAITNCDCCGKGTLEIKCPFSKKDSESCSDPPPYIGQHNKGVVGCPHSLDEKHGYYFQVQGQMLLTKTSYCDFVVFTPNGMHIERIIFDEHFCNEMIQKLQIFYEHCVMPRVLGFTPSPLPPRKRSKRK